MWVHSGQRGSRVGLSPSFIDSTLLITISRYSCITAPWTLW
jgi:hypothetical protein